MWCQVGFQFLWTGDRYEVCVGSIRRCVVSATGDEWLSSEAGTKRQDIVCLSAKIAWAQGVRKESSWRPNSTLIVSNPDHLAPVPPRPRDGMT